MTTISTRISLDQYPSEEDLGLRPLTAPVDEPSHHSSRTLASYDVEALEPADDEHGDDDYIEEPYDRAPLAREHSPHVLEDTSPRDAPDVDMPEAFYLGDANPRRIPDRGLAVAIFGSAAVVACVVVGIIWVTIDPTPTPAATEAAQAFDRTR